MKRTINLESERIDGQKLKAARQAKGLSIAEIAHVLTLSRAQVIHIEEGGDKPFYSPAHKLLAVRKYAGELNLSYEEIVSKVGADQPPADLHDGHTAPQAHHEERPPASSVAPPVSALRSKFTRHHAIIAAVALCFILAIYANIRGSTPTPEPEQEFTAGQAAVPQVSNSSLNIDTASNSPDSATTPTSNIKPAADESCGVDLQTAGIKSWTPAYQRKADSRLFVISPQADTVCIADATGKTERIILSPMAGKAFSGTPPYTIHAANLNQLEMYLQGLRVKVPPESKALRVFATDIPAPPPEDGGKEPFQADRG